MLHSNLERILDEQIAGDEELQRKKHKFHAFESKIDGMIGHDAELDEILKRAKVLIAREFGEVWTDKNWGEIERRLEKNLKDLK